MKKKSTTDNEDPSAVLWKGFCNVLIAIITIKEICTRGQLLQLPRVEVVETWTKLITTSEWVLRYWKVIVDIKEFDEQLQDALDAIDSPPAQNTYERQSGLGLGKDMATILKAEERRGSLEDEESAEKAGNENNQVDETNGGQGENFKHPLYLVNLCV